MVIVTRLARDGRTTVATAPEKALRGEQLASELEDFLRGAPGPMPRHLTGRWSGPR